MDNPDSTRFTASFAQTQDGTQNCSTLGIFWDATVIISGCPIVSLNVVYCSLYFCTHDLDTGSTVVFLVLFFSGEIKNEISFSSGFHQKKNATFQVFPGMIISNLLELT